MIKTLSGNSSLEVLETLASLHANAMDSSWSANDLSAHIEAASDDVIGLYESSALRGFIICRTLFEQAEILTLAVNPSDQKRGFGRSLLRAAEAAITKRGGDIIFLDVAKDNEAAIALYHSEGFVTYAKRPGYYIRTQDGHTTRVTAHLMQKRLTG